MKKKFKILIYISISLILALIIFISVYYILFSMGTAKQISYGDKNSSQKIFMATQGSNFKNELVKEIINNYSDKKIYFEAKDISELPKINVTEWKFLIIIHTVEVYKAPKFVRDFISKNKTNNNIIYIATSGNGKWKHIDIDTITSASKINEIPSIINKIKQIIKI